jgi:hypothetical protein
MLKRKSSSILVGWGLERKIEITAKWGKMRLSVAKWVT